MTEPYIREHAQLYDTLYQDKDYKAEVDFIAEVLKRYNADATRILEVACGTGNHSFLFEKKGFDLYCTDFSPGMIEIAKQKKERSGSSLRFDVLDMRSIPNLPKQYDAAICLFDSIGYTITNEGVIAALSGIQKNLSNGGLLIFEYWHSSAMLRNFEPLRVKKISTPDGEIIRLSETSINFPEQTATVRHTIHIHSNSRQYNTLSEDMKCRFFSLPEMNMFLHTCGFEVLNTYNGYQADEKIDDETWHIVCVARKKSI